jgi:Zn-dependent protease with chaperone function
MYFTILAAIIIALMAEVNVDLAHDPSFDPVAIFLWTVVIVASAPLPGVLLASTLRSEDLQDSFHRARVYRRVRIGTVLCQVWLLAAFAVIVYVVRWPLFTEGGLHLKGWVLVDELARLAPFIAMLLLAWMSLYRVDRMLRMGHWTMREFLEFHVRQYLAFILLPFVVLITIVDAVSLAPWRDALSRTGLDWMIPLGAMALFYLYAPLAMRYVWKTRRLEDGPLRDRLTALCARSGTGYRDILVWETLGGNISNACVIGVAAHARYIMLTDALMDTLTTEEIEAVFGHEIGHVKRWHVTFYVLLTVALSAAFTVLASTSAFQSLRGQSVSDMLSAQGFVATSAALLFWGLGFGFVSRRMELEADLYAVKLTGSTQNFVNGLERISFHSGRPRAANSWRHFSVARRTAFLLACEADPLRLARFNIGMRLLRVAIIALALLSVAAATCILLG